jgi:hypothetical protein
MEETKAPERPAHEILIDEFNELDKMLQEVIEKFTNGRIILECLPPDGAATYSELFEKLIERYVKFQEYARELIEKRNAKLQEAAAAFRSAVMMPETALRGPDGKPTFKKYMNFEVNSKTSRFFNPDTLFGELQKLGLGERLFDITYVNKSSGQIEKAAKQEWVIDFDSVKNWLRESNLESVLTAAYEEEESTPAVTGPKPVGWIGDVDKSKKGKK